MKIVAATLGAAVLAAPAAAAAAPANGVSCVAQATMEYTASPTPLGGQSHYISQEPSSIRCAGQWGGSTLAGTGSFSSSGTYATGGSLYLPSAAACLAGSGRGSFRASLPTGGLGGGSVRLEATYKFVQIASTRYLTGEGSAEFRDSSFGSPRPAERREDFSFSGVGQVVPGPGPGCLTTGMTSSSTIEELELGPEGRNTRGGVTDDGETTCARERVGSPRRDRLTGTPGSDLIRGRGGDDAIQGRGGPDCLHGDSGRDLLVGASGGDLVAGGTGADVMRGGAGDDALLGGAGSDFIDAGKGADRIDARDGRPDRVRCGPGADEARVDTSDRVSGCEQIHT
jgi:Ca2+-binding RTX toxin-like protein